MMFDSFNLRGSPFAESQRNADSFCYNMIFSYTVSQCVEKMLVAEKQFNDAKLDDDIELIETKRVELMSYQSSLMLTAYVLSESEEIIA